MQRKKPAATETSVSSPPPEITLEDDTVDTTVFIVSNVGDNNSSCPTIESIDIDVLLEPEEGMYHVCVPKNQSNLSPLLTFIMFIDHRL